VENGTFNVGALTAVEKKGNLVPHWAFIIPPSFFLQLGLK